MAVRRVSRDEDPSDLVVLRDSDPQVPESDVVQLDLELESSGFLHQPAKIEAVSSRTRRRRRMKEEALTDVDASEKLPVTLELGTHDPVRRAVGETLEPCVQLAGAEHGEDHGLLEI